MTRSAGRRVDGAPGSPTTPCESKNPFAGRPHPARLCSSPPSPRLARSGELGFTAALVARRDKIRRRRPPAAAEGSARPTGRIYRSPHSARRRPSASRKSSVRRGRRPGWQERSRRKRERSVVGRAHNREALGLGVQADQPLRRAADPRVHQHPVLEGRERLRRAAAADLELCPHAPRGRSLRPRRRAIRTSRDQSASRMASTSACSTTTTAPSPTLGSPRQLAGRPRLPGEGAPK
jgi:hypothetical protein